MNLREEDLRSYIENRLKQKGIKTEREVACGNGVRADLVTPDTVIEVKKQLNRGAIYQAYGQGVAYQTLLKKPKLMIIGLAPSSEARYQEAQRIAENVRNDSVQVVFLDKDPKWGLTKAAIAQLMAATAEPSAQEPANREQSVKARPAKPPVRLPFDVAAADLEGPGEGAGEGQTPAKTSGASGGKPDDGKPDGKSRGKSNGKSGSGKTGKSADESAARQPAVSLKDVWSLLLIILLFLWIRAFLGQTTGQRIIPDGTPLQPVGTPQPDPSLTPFTVPSVPQK